MLDTAQVIAVLTAAALGLGTVGTFVWRRLLAPAFEHVIERILAGVDERLEAGDERMDRIESTVGDIAHDLNGHEGGVRDRLAKIEASLAEFASQEAGKIRDLMARQDDRGPFDRRENT